MSNNKEDSISNPSKKPRKENPLSRFHQNSLKIQNFAEQNERIALELGFTESELNEFWRIWDEERPVPRFTDFMKNEKEGKRASADELQELLSSPASEWQRILSEDKIRRYHRALGCVSTNEAISALKKRQKLKEVKSPRPVFR